MNIWQPLSYLYGKIVQWRNHLYDSGKRVSIQFTIPVISVGNLSTGGTGKTPHVAYLAEVLLKKGYPTAVLSRGYKRRTNGFVLADEHSTTADIGDEAVQLKKKFPRLIVAVSENRALGIPLLLHCAPNEPRIIILDDAFQHRAVKPQFSILLTEYHRPYTRDQLLPSGRLREPISGAVRADVIVVSKSPNNLTEDNRRNFIAELQPKSHQIILFSYLKYGHIYPLQYLTDKAVVPNQVISITSNDNISVLLLCGIAHTDDIEQYVRDKYLIVETLYFADHHPYTSRDIQKVYKKWSELRGEHKIVLTTEKDAARLYPLSKEIATLQLPIYCLPVSVYFNEQDTAILIQQLESHIVPDHDELHLLQK